MNHSLWKIYKRQPTHVRTIMTPSKQFLVFLIYVVLVLPTHNNTLKILFFQEFTVLKHGLFIISVWSFFQNRNKMDACSENSECLKASFERQLFICRVSWIFPHLLIGLHSGFLLLSSLFSCSKSIIEISIMNRALSKCQRIYW